MMKIMYMMLLQDQRWLIGIHPVTTLHMRFETLSQFEFLRATGAFEISNGHVNDTVMPIQIRFVRKISSAEKTRKFLDGRRLFDRMVRVRAVERWWRHRRREQRGMVRIRNDGDQGAGFRVEERRRWRT